MRPRQRRHDSLIDKQTGEGKRARQQDRWNHRQICLSMFRGGGEGGSQSIREFNRQPRDGGQGQGQRGLRIGDGQGERRG